MALLMVQEGVQPAGQYDYADSYSMKGGEVWVLASTGPNSDGYQVVKARVATGSDGYGPFYLGDDGLTGYGVLFGNTVSRTATGFTAGADSGTRLGPGSYVGSGKVTLWDKPGLYAVTLDALGGQTKAAGLAAALPGAKLTVASGVLTLTGATQTGPAVATVVAFKLDEALVTTGGSVVSHQKLVISFDPHGQVV